MGPQPVNHPLRIGLTGGIGSGKSAVTGLFASLKVPIIDADTISHDLVKKGRPAYDAIIKAFGRKVVDEQGDLRRDHLRHLIFNNDKLKKQLESIIHPLVGKEINGLIDDIDYPYCLISIPLLYESGRQNSVDRVLVVDLPEQLQIERASSRDGVGKGNIVKIINTQISRKERLQRADDIISNDRDLEFLQDQVNVLHNKYLQIAGSRSGPGGLQDY